MKIEEEKNKTRERRKKKKEMNQDMAMVGSVRENEWIVKIKIIILYD